MKPLFMWAGGKGKMLKNYMPHLPYKFDTYVEPFFGGGAMFIWACQSQPDASYILNDINPGIMGIYKAIQSDVESFLTELNILDKHYIALDKASRKDYYYAVRQSHAYDYQAWSATKEAATLYFLMRTGFNGIWQINQNTNNRFGTPCGLLEQQGSVYDVENVWTWHRALQRAVLHTGDFASVALPPGKAFIFMDPPYRDSFTQYGTDFHDAEQIRVLDQMRIWMGAGHEVWVTNRDSGDGFWEREGKDFQLKKFPITYTAGRRKQVGDGYEAKQATEVLLIGRG